MAGRVVIEQGLIAYAIELGEGQLRDEPQQPRVGELVLPQGYLADRSLLVHFYPLAVVRAERVAGGEFV